METKILFFKSHVSAYVTKKGVFVPAHFNKRTSRVDDNHTADMFARNVPPSPKRDIPIEALERPEDYTPDMFSGEIKSEIKTGERSAKQDADELRDYLNYGDLRSAIDQLTYMDYERAREVLLRAGFSIPSHKKSTRNLIVSVQDQLLQASKPQTMAKSTQPRILFLKSHVKQYTRKDGTVVEEHDDKRMKQMQSAPAARPAAKQPPQEPTTRDAEDVRGSAHGYGTHNIEEGDTIHFKAGEFSGAGKVKAIGKDGAQVEDASGRVHNVHWHEVTGFKADRGDGGGKKPPGENDKPIAEGEDPPKKDEPQKPVVLGKQEPIPAESFNASDYAKSHDQADASPESIIAEFPADTKEKIAMAVERLTNIEQTIGKFKVDDGDYAEARKAIHEKILWGGGEVFNPKTGKKEWRPGLLANANNAKPAKGEKPTFTILGGRGGSGKSSFKNNVYDPNKCIVLDADAIKEMMPEYEGWNAFQVHEESSDIVEAALEFARINGLNVVLDATMKTAKTAIAKVEALKAAGFRTEAHYMHLPRQEAAKRAVQRFIDGGEHGRYVPIEAVLANTGNEAAFDQIKGMVDAWSFSDNNVAMGEKPILISSSDDNREPTSSGTEYTFKSGRDPKDLQDSYLSAQSWAGMTSEHKNLFREEKDAIGSPDLDHHVARDSKGNVIGMAVCRRIEGGGTSVFALVTSPEHSGEGCASELLRKVIENDKKQGGTGEVSLQSFPWSKPYYEHIGFAQEKAGMKLSAANAEKFITNRKNKFKDPAVEKKAQSAKGVFAKGAQEEGMTKAFGERRILIIRRGVRNGK